jgi:GNAT superfamily N-acetyltransferase
MEIPEFQRLRKLFCRLLRQDDLPEILSLLEEVRPEIAGLTTRTIYATICQKALIDERVVFVVAEGHGKLKGFAIAIIDRNCFWASFLCKHPLLALRIALRRFLRLTIVGRTKEVPDPKQLEIIEKCILSPPSDRSWWKDSSPQIAKGLFIAVHKKHQSKGIGRELLRYRDKVLEDRGVKRVDGIILMHRIPSVKLFYSEGFRIEKKNNRFFVTKDFC